MHLTPGILYDTEASIIRCHGDGWLVLSGQVLLFDSGLAPSLEYFVFF